MLRLISLAMFALVGFSSAAPAPAHSNSVAMAESSAATMPMNWNQQDIESILSARIAQAMDKDSIIMVKRADDDAAASGAPPLSLDTLFRGIFNNVINHIIEVTPLNDIVHGNYDFLYELFLGKVQEILTGTTGDAPAPSDEGDSEYDEDDEDNNDDDEDEDDEDDYENDEDDNEDDEDDNEDDEDDEDEENNKHWKHKHHNNDE